MGSRFEDKCKQNIYNYLGIIYFTTLYLTQNGLDVSEGKTPKITQPILSHLKKTGKDSLVRTFILNSIFIFVPEYGKLCRLYGLFGWLTSVYISMHSGVHGVR